MASSSSCSKFNSDFKTKMTTRAKRRQLIFLIATIGTIVVVMSRRQENDDEDLDRGASAPYQDQGDGQKSTDGYEDNEPDGPYDETPRDEEGQADLERFFDDHLGASEKEGMDQENLPSNLRPHIVEAGRDLELAMAASEPDFQTTQLLPTYTAAASESPSSYLDNIYLNTQQSRQQHQGLPPNVETSFIKLPNQKLIITRQITRGPVYKGGLDISHVPSLLNYNQDNINSNENDNNKLQRRHKLDATGSDIIATENDEFDRVYVTNQTNKPFRIADLGGYDPEEDFQDASRDFEESERQRKPKEKSSRGESRGDTDENNSGNSNERGQEIQPSKDITFNDEADMLFNDASETDEVFFTNDPYQNDLEAEITGEQQAGAEKPTMKNSNNEEETEPVQPEASDKSNEKISRGGERPSEDEAEGSWVNDGVEDMDVPSQAYQDEVLEKAAEAQEAAALAVKKANDGTNEQPTDDEQQPISQQEQEQQQQQQQQQDGYNNENPQNQEPDSQRMPNADYMKEDMNVDDLNDIAR